MIYILMIGVAWVFVSALLCMGACAMSSRFSELRGEDELGERWMSLSKE